jgi:alkaline phosphatase
MAGKRNFQRVCYEKKEIAPWPRIPDRVVPSVSRPVVRAGLFLVLASARPGPGSQARYVFLFIGDGMALAQRSAAEYYAAAAQGQDRPGRSSWP